MGVKQKQRVYLTNEDSTPSEKTFITTKVELGYNSDGTLSTKVLSQEELTPPQAHDPIELNHDKVVWLFNELARNTISNIGIPVAYYGRTDDGVVVITGDRALEQLKGEDIDFIIVELRDRFATYLFDEGVEDDRAVEIAEEVINEDFLVVYRNEFLDAIKSVCADCYDKGLRYFNTKDELQKEFDEGTFPPREDLSSLLNGDTELNPAKWDVDTRIFHDRYAVAVMAENNLDPKDFNDWQDFRDELIEASNEFLLNAGKDPYSMDVDFDSVAHKLWKDQVADITDLLKEETTSDKGVE